MDELERMKLEAEEFKQGEREEKFLTEIKDLNDQLSFLHAHISEADLEIERLEGLMREIQAATSDIAVVDITDRALCDA